VSGFIAMNRCALEHPALNNADRFGAWFWLVAYARWDGDCGTISFTWPTFIAHMGWNKLSAKRCIAYFAKHGMISMLQDGRQVTVTILDRTTFDLAAMEGNGPGIASSPMILGGRARPVFGAERDPIPAKVRLAVMLRDGAKCTYCDDTNGPFEIDHILAVANGGSNDPENLCVACAPCNRSKGAKPLEEWRRA